MAGTARDAARRAIPLVLFVVITVACGVAPGIPGDWPFHMVDAVNAERAANGLPPVTGCGSLHGAAAAHSDHQAAIGQITHTGSGGSNVQQRVEGAGYQGWTALGENLAAGQGDVATVMGAWMNSAAHRDIVLGSNFDHIGVGVSISHGTPYWTQVFGRSGSC